MANERWELDLGYYAAYVTHDLLVDITAQCLSHMLNEIGLEQTRATILEVLRRVEAEGRAHDN